MKNNERLLRIISDIDEEFIENALPKQKKSNNKKLWLCIAACVAVVILSFTVSVQNEKLPTLTVTKTEDAMGFEGYMAHSIDELINNNPWTAESKIKKLPVYKNTFFKYTDDWTVTNPDKEKMKNILSKTAAAFDMESVKITENIAEENGIFSVSAENDDYLIKVNEWLQVNIEFKKDVLPSEYSFSFYESYESFSKNAKYLKSSFKKLLENTETDISGGDYDIYENRCLYLSFYETAEDETERVINYNFRRISFYGDDSGKLKTASVSYPDIGEKIGDYPIIDEEEALKLLCDGHFVTSVTDNFPTESKVKKVELIYRNTRRDEIYMPYYKFYVELDLRVDGNMNCYGAYYVPAVESRYIENMPLWDGSIN